MGHTTPMLVIYQRNPTTRLRHMFVWRFGSWTSAMHSVAPTCSFEQQYGSPIDLVLKYYPFPLPQQSNRLVPRDILSVCRATI